MIFFLFNYGFCTLRNLFLHNKYTNLELLFPIILSSIFCCQFLHLYEKINSNHDVLKVRRTRFDARRVILFRLDKQNSTNKNTCHAKYVVHACVNLFKIFLRDTFQFANISAVCSYFCVFETTCLSFVLIFLEIQTVYYKGFLSMYNVSISIKFKMTN